MSAWANFDRLSTGRYARAAAICLCVWTIVGLFRASEDIIQEWHWRSADRYDWRALVSINLFIAYCQAGMTPIVFALGRRFPIERPRRATRFLLHTAFSLAATHAVILLFTLAALLLGAGRSLIHPTFTGVFVAAYVGGFHLHILGYWSILGLHHAVHYHRLFLERDQYAARLQVRDSELRRELAYAQLSALQAQLRPHFLFNTLNAVAALVRQERFGEACDMLAGLRQLLHRVVRDGEAQEIPLRRELDYLGLYLSIERVRFGDRLSVETSIEPPLLDAAVPSLCLQPLVENCIRHGISRTAGGGRILISARQAGDEMLLQVEDNGRGLSRSDALDVTGLGISNTRARLRQLYGDRGSFFIDARPGGGTRATLALPYHCGLRHDEGVACG